MLDTTERKLFQGHRDFSRFIHELSLARKIRIGICEAFTAIIDEEISNNLLTCTATPFPSFPIVDICFHD